jgi:hypothetical protein
VQKLLRRRLGQLLMRALVATALLALLGCGDGLSPGGKAETRFGAASKVSDTDAVWFCPNVGSTDLLRLFTNPSEWSKAREKVGVFQFYAQQLAATDAAGCRSCGDNIRPNLVAAGVFAQLAAWGTRIAFETGAVKHHTCDGEVAAAAASAIVDVVLAQGAQVHYVAMDEPYIGGEQVVSGMSCRYTMAQSAAQAARFIRKLESMQPGVRVGDIEPYPYYRVDKLKAWTDEVLRNGGRPAFFHLDVDRNALKGTSIDVAGELRALSSFFASRGIPFGVIYSGHELDIPRGAADPDRSYYDAVLKWVRTVNSALGAPDQNIFQSWLLSADGRNVVPRNLTEAAYSHTRLVNDGWNVLSPPPDAATIKVAHGYQGILGRAADPGGLAAYASALRASGRTLDFTRSLFDSEEFRINRGSLTPEQLADALYLGLLERGADPGGFASTVAEIRAGRRADVSSAMLDSAEFRSRFLP